MQLIQNVLLARMDLRRQLPVGYLVFLNEAFNEKKPGNLFNENQKSLLKGSPSRIRNAMILLLEPNYLFSQHLFGRNS